MSESEYEKLPPRGKAIARLLRLKPESFRENPDRGKYLAFFVATMVLFHPVALIMTSFVARAAGIPVDGPLYWLVFIAIFSLGAGSIAKLYRDRLERIRSGLAPDRPLAPPFLRKLLQLAGFMNDKFTHVDYMIYYVVVWLSFAYILPLAMFVVGLALVVLGINLSKIIIGSMFVVLGCVLTRVVYGLVAAIIIKRRQRIDRAETKRPTLRGQIG
ncbi:hypothetical protein [Azorhizobium oxalatiphilum]|uniref:hypothetical protein n=1 Tax=Azorhizobium oxalatiphilum TaxID=980631 RepID=UPI0016668C6F|nr:hypothetical protein [Azorhizobium oxalatiphilum]